jgi:transposase
VMCYSRMMYVEFTVSQTMEHFLDCHQHAFQFFGGVPAKVMVDYVPRNIIHLMWPTGLCGQVVKSY